MCDVFTTESGGAMRELLVVGRLRCRLTVVAKRNEKTSTAAHFVKLALHKRSPSSKEKD